MDNLNWGYKPTAIATKYWISQVKTREHVRDWHKQFTPWFTDAQIDLVLQYYDEQLKNQQQQKQQLTDFQKTLLDL